ncbi:hypothetical protein [Helicobacter typhlonius]|uniref:toxin-antitoxin system YwqK family antitoxin n=1 Tax=Helicobacter typhlonius TaxID=76936 RepID=UPI002FDFC7E5
MLKKIVNAAMLLSACLFVGYANPLPECEKHQDWINGCVEKEYVYPSGQVSAETPYKDFKKNGVKKEYYESGKLLYEVLYENGEMNGVRKAYYESGKLSYEALWENNEEISYKKYDEQGKLINQRKK